MCSGDAVVGVCAWKLSIWTVVVDFESSRVGTFAVGADRQNDAPHDRVACTYSCNQHTSVLDGQRLTTSGGFRVGCIPSDRYTAILASN